LRRLRTRSNELSSRGAGSARCSLARAGVLIETPYTVWAAALPGGVCAMAAIGRPRGPLAFAGMVARISLRIAGHIQRGEGTGPMKPRQPPSVTTGRCQFQRDVWRASCSSPHRDTAKNIAKGAPMAVSHLQWPECKAEYPLEALYVCERCFGPLQVAYDYSALERDVAGLRRRIQGGPQNIWRYADFLPLAGGPPGPSGRLASRVGLPAGCTPLIRADRLGQRGGPRGGGGQEDGPPPR